MTSRRDQVYQIKITLKGVRPPVWRRLQVPVSYSFWDLHVAIQDAMGWLDCHLHEFRVAHPHGGHSVRIGIPDEDAFVEDEPTVPGWKIPIRKYLTPENCRATYAYDFGDGWEHAVRLEKVLPRMPDVAYPLCLAGRRKCPPEDVGGVHGYERFLAALRDPQHEEHESYLTWVGGSFDAEAFSPALVRFDDPDERWRVAFEEEE